MYRAIATALYLLIVVPPAMAKRKDDIVVMRNGDRFTGEIKRLEDGKLYFSASYMVSEVALDWTQVDHVESKDLFNVYLTDGSVHTGFITDKSLVGDGNGTFTIRSDAADVPVGRNEVVRARPIEDSSWKQMTGSIDYGYNFTGGNNSTTQSSLASSLAYRAQRWSMQFDGSSVFNSQSEGTSTGRNTFSFLYARQLTQRWYAAMLSDLLNSKQQDLTLRATAGGGLGRSLVRSERTALGVVAGVLFSRERYSSDTGSEPRANNAEALLLLKYEMYRFKKVDVKSVVYGYPSLTDTGRIRMGLQSSLGIELFRNFKWKFNLYENFDSRPPVNAPKNDFGTGTSVGWTF
ncbi:MAG TPA: DUF481 domain-containing protein [Terriglobales bacterium]